MAYLTMLAEMMDKDLVLAVRRLSEHGMKQLDLKNHVFHQPVDDLDDERRVRLSGLIHTAGAEIYCFSSMLGYQNVSRIEESKFRHHLSQGIDNLLRTATYIRPQMIRLLACSFDERVEWSDSNQYLEHRAPWVYSAYQDAINQLAKAGLQVTIENEPDSIFSSPGETLGFFEHLGLTDSVGFTWDIQNMWQSGTFPSLEAYQTLKPIINYVHVKGGCGTPAAPHVMTYRSSLEEAGWPVVDILTHVLADDVSPVICLNTSHGVTPKDYEFASLVGTPELARAEASRDAAFLRATFREII